MDEIWKDVNGYYGLYQISNFGRVRSLPRLDNVVYSNGTIWSRKRKGLILRQQNSNKGYKLVSLYKEGVGCSHFVHRLVAIEFLPNPYDLPQVNHKDGDKNNNAVSNLEWCTCDENIEHAFKIGLRKSGVS